MKRPWMAIPFGLFLAVLFTPVVNAQVPHLIRFQGKVTNRAGAPLTGVYNITFRVYNAEAGGTLLWSETQPGISVNNGIFTVLLGSVSSLDLPFNEPYWLSMEVNDDGEMEPRQRITSVGYAYYAEKAKEVDQVSIVPPGAIILWKGSSCPSGYARLTELDGRFIVSGPSYNAAAGGSNTHNHGGATGSHTLSENEMPSHRHETWGEALPLWPLGLAGTTNNFGSAGGHDFDNYRYYTSYTGGGQGHTHTVASADSRPEFATLLFCQKE